MGRDDSFEPPDERIGQVFGRYQVRSVLGRGGMSVVYEAIHVDIGQRAAVKLLHPALANQVGYRERFFREAVAASKVEHPGLVRVSDYGEHSDGTLFIIMEYLEGPLLRELLLNAPERRLSLQLSLSIALQLAEALASAHGSGVIHCDLKPDNVKWVEESAASHGHRIKILDFGIARISDSTTPPTLHNIGLTGTPAYMSPERCAGQRAVDGQTDVYALGCILFETLSGQTPFVGQAADLLLNHRYTDPPPLRELVAELPDEVGSLVSALLHKHSEDRPTMQDTAARLSVLVAKCENGTLTRRKGHRRLLALLGKCWRWTAAWISLLLVALGVGYLAASYRFWFTMVRIRGGRFVMGMDEKERSVDEIRREHERLGYPVSDWTTISKRSAPLRVVVLSPFLIDRTEVTCANWASWLQEKHRDRLLEMDFVERNGKEYPLIKLGDRLIANLYDNPLHACIRFENGRFVTILGREKWPANSISWAGAQSFCLDRGARLPTEAEWEFVARNDGEDLFPWGSQLLSCDGVIIERDPDTVEPVFQRCGNQSPGLVDIGSGRQDRTRQGVWDLGGSVMEWVADCYRVSYPLVNTKNPRVDKDGDHGAAAEQCSLRVLRGGAWSGSYLHALGFSRNPTDPNLTPAYAGFRCAKDL